MNTCTQQTSHSSFNFLNMRPNFLNMITLLFGSDRSSRNANVCSEITTFCVRKSPPSSVRSFLICQELSIFIFMAQIYFKSTQRVLREHSESTQMTLIEHK